MNLRPPGPSRNDPVELGRFTVAERASVRLSWPRVALSLDPGLDPVRRTSSGGLASLLPGPLGLSLYFLRCELEEVYSVVPVAQGHALAIGMVRYRQELFFGCYADPDALPEVDQLASLIEAELRELGRSATLARGSDARPTRSLTPDPCASCCPVAGDRPGWVSRIPSIVSPARALGPLPLLPWRGTSPEGASGRHGTNVSTS